MEDSSLELLIQLSVFNDLSNDSINNILNLLKDYYGAVNCVWARTVNSHRNDDYYYINDIECQDNLKIILNNDNQQEVVVIYNPTRNKDSNSFRESSVVVKTLLNKLIIIDKLFEKANTDLLTNTLNDNALEERKSRKYFINSGVAFIDANGLGIINNTYGHEAGDEMLKSIAQAIKSVFRKKDVFRIHGDEFIVLCENIDKNLFCSKLELVRQRINESGYSASFGAVYADKLSEINELIKLADDRMFIEKEEYRRNNPDKYSITKIH